MKSWRFHAFGSINNLKVEEVPVPEPGPGEALVRLEYAALNPADRFLIEGRYPRPGKPPFAVGRDGCGTIERAAPGGRLAAGQRVVVLRSDVGVTREGTLAEFVAVPEESLAPLPEGWSPAEGAAGPLVMLTAWMALVDEGRLAPGQPVLVTGASGGVGTAAVQLASALGGRVAVLSRSEARRVRLRELGAEWTFDPAAPDWVARAQVVIPGGRVQVVVENLAGPFLNQSVALTGHRGRVCVVGLLAGEAAELHVGKIMFKRIHIIGVAVGDYTPPELQCAWAGIVAALAKTGARPLIDRVYPFDQVPAAFDHLWSDHMGKIVIGPIHG